MTSTPDDELSTQPSRQGQKLHESQSSDAADDTDGLPARLNGDIDDAAAAHAAANEDVVGTDVFDGAKSGVESQHNVSTNTAPQTGDADVDSATVHDAGQVTSEIVGFASFMLTHAPPEPVIYLYELHLRPSYRSQGLGAHLLRTIEAIGRSVGVQRAMLTVFKSNVDARKWYAKQGWTIDCTSPADVELRGGTRECDYEIWSKVL